MDATLMQLTTSRSCVKLSAVCRCKLGFLKLSIFLKCFLLSNWLWACKLLRNTHSAKLYSEVWAVEIFINHIHVFDFGAFYLFYDLFRQIVKYGFCFLSFFFPTLTNWFWGPMFQFCVVLSVLFSVFKLQDTFLVKLWNNWQLNHLLNYI